MSKYLNDLLTDALAWATCEGCEDRADFFADELESGVSDEQIVAATHSYWLTEGTIRVFRQSFHKNDAQAVRAYLHDLRTERAKVDPIAAKIARWIVEVIDTQYVNRETRLSWLDWPTPEQRSEARAWRNLATNLIKD
jgi:hypothetical protein